MVEKTDDDLSYLVRKYLILLAAEIFSTYSLMICVFTPLFITFFSFDTMINGWCLILYDARYDHIYLRIFGKCAKKKSKTEMDIDKIDSSTSQKSSTNKSSTTTNKPEPEIDLADYLDTDKTTKSAE